MSLDGAMLQFRDGTISNPGRLKKQKRVHFSRIMDGECYVEDFIHRIIYQRSRL